MQEHIVIHFRNCAGMRQRREVFANGITRGLGLFNYCFVASFPCCDGGVPQPLVVARVLAQPLLDLRFHMMTGHSFVCI